MFGCDESTAPRVAYRLICFNCLGEGCEKCEGEGTLPYFRCPTASIEVADAEVIRALSYYRKDPPVWPIAGGWRDQANALIVVLPRLVKIASHFEKKANG